MVDAHVVCLWCVSEVDPHSQNKLLFLLFLTTVLVFLITLNVAFHCRIEKRIMTELWSCFAEVVQVI